MKRSFTPQHQLQDAENEYIDAVYKFRQAEKDPKLDYDYARRNMNRLEKKVQELRYKLYSGK